MKPTVSGSKKPAKAYNPTSGNTPSARPVVRVSQATIDKIKKDGMTKSLRIAALGGGNREYKEAIKRMYSATRIADAKKALAAEGKYNPTSGNTPSIPKKKPAKPYNPTSGNMPDQKKTPRKPSQGRM